MLYNNKKLRVELWKQYLTDAKIMRDAGMSEDTVKALKRHTEEEYNSERRFYRNVDEYIDPKDDTYAAPVLLDNALGVLDGIENPRLHNAMMNLKEDEREIIILHVVDGLPLKLIAALWDKPYRTIVNRYYRAIEKIKNYF